MESLKTRERIVWLMGSVYEMDTVHACDRDIASKSVTGRSMDTISGLHGKTPHITSRRQISEGATAVRYRK